MGAAGDGVCRVAPPLGWGKFRRIRFFWIPLWFVPFDLRQPGFARSNRSPAGSIELYPMAMELKPFLYLLFTFVWVNRLEFHRLRTLFAPERSCAPL